MTEYGPAVENDPRMKTADGATITDGATLWNYYDLEWVMVDFEASKPDESSRHGRGPDGDYWDGWFTVRSVDAEHGRGRYTLNGERMASRKTGT